MPVDAGHIDINDPHGRPSPPFAAVSSNFFFEAAFCGKDREGGPTEACSEGCVRRHALLTNAAGDCVDELLSGFATDVCQIVERQNGARRTLRERLDGVIRSAR